MNLTALEGLSAAGRAAALGAAAGVVALLVAMYFLKLKRVRREISSTFLWKKSVQDMRANSPFQRLRRNLLLFLQLLILLAALLALGRLALNSGEGTGVTYIVLVDNSASMAAVDVRPSRLDEARSQIAKVISDMAGRDSMMIMTFAAHPKVVATLTDDKNALRAALRSIEPTAARTEMSEPLRLADALARTAPNPEIIVVSDGAFLTPVGLESVSAPLRFIAVGERSRNVGITAMNVRRGVEDPSAGEIFAGIANTSAEDISVDVALSIDGRLADVSRILIAAGGAHAAVFKVSLAAERLAEISIDVDDDLAADNRAWAILEPPSEIDVTIVGPANPFLRRALSAGGRFRVSEADREPAALPGGSSLPVYVYDGSAPESLSQAGYLIFNAVAPAPGFARLGVLEAPVILDVDTASPVTSLLDLGDVYIAKALKMAFPPETRVLVTSDETPLVALSYAAGARIVTVAFDPMESRWPLRISFPMFINNAVTFLSGGTEALSARQLATGDVLVVPGEAGLEKVVITDPAGRVSELAGSGEGTVTYGDTGRAGVYAVELGSRKVHYAANLANSAETDITPRAQMAVGSQTIAAASAIPAKNREIWRELLVIAFLVLMAEWYVYNRRVFI